MALTEKYIEKVRVGGTTADFDHIIAAKYISATTTNSPDAGYKTWKDITDLITASTDLVPLDTLPEANETNYNKYKNDIILIPAATSATGNERDEYIILKTGTASPYTYKWEKIGTTAADLATKADKGTYTSSTPSTNATSSAGAQTASGTATVTYNKSSNQTQSTGSTATSNTSEYAGTSVSVTGLGFSGTKATLSLTTDYQPAGTISNPDINLTKTGKTVVTGGTTTSVVTGVEASGTTTAVTAVGANGTASVVTTAIKGAALSTGTTATTGYVKYLEAATHSAASLGTASTTTVVTSVGADGTDTAIKTLGGASFLNGATVNSGVLSWTTATAYNTVSATFTALKGVKATGTATVVTGYPNFNGGGFTPTTMYATITTTAAGSTDKTTVLTGVKATGSTTVLTGVQASGTTDAYTSLSTTTVNHVTGAALAATPTFTGTTATLSVSTEYTPAGSVTGGSVAIPKHSHTYVTLPAHTHGITLTATTITGTAAVAVASHTHDLGNHTHNTAI